jgi:hypothetical protein
MLARVRSGSFSGSFFAIFVDSKALLRFVFAFSGAPPGGPLGDLSTHFRSHESHLSHRVLSVLPPTLFIRDENENVGTSEKFETEYLWSRFLELSLRITGKHLESSLPVRKISTLYEICRGRHRLAACPNSAASSFGLRPEGTGSSEDAAQRYLPVWSSALTSS